jgi:hypothetical protein
MFKTANSKRGEAGTVFRSLVFWVWNLFRNSDLVSFVADRGWLHHGDVVQRAPRNYPTFRPPEGRRIMAVRSALTEKSGGYMGRLIDRNYKLLSGHSMPVLGLGTWGLAGSACERIVSKALELGYWHIDTAQLYGNEAEIGRAPW